PDLDPRHERIPHLDKSGALDNSRRELLRDPLVNQDAAAAVAALACVEVDAEDGGIECGVPIAVGKDDLRVLAAEFHRHLLERLCRFGHGLLADARRSRERQQSTSGCVTSTSPTTLPRPTRMLTTPAG